MSVERQDSLSSANVRNLIFAYERQSSGMEPLEEFEGRQRAKSIGNALSYKLFRQSNLEIHNLLDIEKELVKIEAHLNYYETYEKETHVAFQEQLFNVLTNIVSIDPEDHDHAIEKKRKLIVETQKLFKVLNSKLPFNGTSLHKGLRRTYSSVVRREEAVVSTTSVKSQEHRAVLSSSQSTLNGGFMSEESISSSRHDDSTSSVDFNQVQEKREPATPPPQKEIVNDTESSYIPSVSKLKKFFSFRRDDRPEVKVISAAYSGVSRSQSLNLKTNRYTVIKREKNEGAQKRENIISENDEDVEEINNQRLITSSQIHINPENTKNGDVEISLYEEPATEIEEYRDIQREAQHNVSVSKLKSLFEDRKHETDEGLELLTKNRTEFRSDFNLPYTEANLGAFRLKRTISGNYMHFPGLLRNVDIDKKGDLNKSKSMSDLKTDKFQYELNDIDIDDNFSKEIDGDDDDFEHVSINVGKEAEEPNNNFVKTAEIFHTSNYSKGQHWRQSSHSGIVHVIKNSYESRSATGPAGDNEDIKHIIHRTIEPIPNPSNASEEPVLKIPIQLRTGFTNISNFDAENKTKTSNDQQIEEPVLKIPVQLRTGVDDVEDNDSLNDRKEHAVKVDQNVTSGTVETLKQTFEHLSTRTGDEFNQEINHVLHRTIDPILSNNNSSEEPVLKVPIQLRTGFSANDLSEEHIVGISSDESSSATATVDQNVSSGSVEALKQTFENLHRSNSQESSENVSHILHRVIEPTEGRDASSEPMLKIPIQLRMGFSNSAEEIEHLSHVDSQQSNEDDVSHIQLRTGFSSSAKLVESNIETAHISSGGNREKLENNTQDTNNTKARLVDPIQLRINEDIVTYDNNVNGTTSEIPISLYNGSEVITAETESKANETMGRAQIESKTQNFMQILESPTAFSTLVSTSSTHVSHRIVSSSSSSQSSELSSQKYHKVLQEPNLHSILTLSTPDSSNEEEESSVTITEITDEDQKETPKVNLSVSQENIIEEILKDGDTLENVDEEFEKMLQEYNK